MGVVLATEEVAEEGLDNAQVGRFVGSNKAGMMARSPFSELCFQGTSFAFFAGPGDGLRYGELRVKNSG